MSVQGRNLKLMMAASGAALMLGACESYGTADYDEPVKAAVEMNDSEALGTIIAARSDQDKARDAWRHPGETLAFFGVDSDDAVVEALPGGGWYTRVVAPYVMENGNYAAINYAYDMYPLILPNPTPEVLARIEAWPETFPGRAGEWVPGIGDVQVASFGSVPADMLGSADVILAVRALHNFNRAGGDYTDQAVADMYAILKPGGTLGVVQHRASADAQGPNGDGSVGYMTQASVIAMMEDAGFVFEEASEINANPADQPESGEIVWRLPPTLALGEANRDAYAAIGESDRMTLRFRKPSE